VKSNGLVGEEVILTREVTKIEKVKGTCIAMTDQTVTLEFENRGRMITRTYPMGGIKDVSRVEILG